MKRHNNNNCSYTASTLPDPHLKLVLHPPLLSHPTRNLEPDPIIERIVRRARPLPPVANEIWHKHVALLERRLEDPREEDTLRLRQGRGVNVCAANHENAVRVRSMRLFERGTEAGC